MDIRRLQAFLQVYAHRSFSRAGDELLLSQPTISAHILSLEEELGVPLFDRLGRSVTPTQAGEVLVRHAQSVFATLDLARSEILALANRVAGELIVGGSSIPAHYVIPKLAARFLHDYPEVRLQVKVGDTRDIMQLVLDGGAHVGLIGAVVQQSDLVCRPFLDDLLLLVAPTDMDVPDLAADDWRERLTALPWIMRESGSGTQAAMLSAFTAAGLDLGGLAPVLTVHSTLAALECVEAGLGLSVVSYLAAKPYFDRGTIRQIDLPHCHTRRQFAVVSHAKRHQFPALLAFLRACGVA